MKDKVKRGPKKKWSDSTISILKAEIERRVDEKGSDVISICSELALEEPWTSFLNSKDGTYYGPDLAEALRKAYYQPLNRAFVRVARDARLYHVAISDLDGWTRFVLGCVTEKKKNGREWVREKEVQ